MQRILAEAVPILARLEEAGHEAYFVGGCVRDNALGRDVADVDIATSALPERVMELFPRTVPTGLAHGTVTILEEGRSYEVTTFRAESEYERHRRPSGVSFIADLRGDLLRRDFTINAMAMDRSGAVIDPFDGMADMRLRRIRAVGDPDARMNEDALRMLRGVRFAAALGYRIAHSSWRAIRKHGPLLRHIAMERVGAELDKMLSGAHPDRAARLLARSGLWRAFAAPFPAAGQCAAPLDALALGAIAAPDDRWAALLLAAGADHASAGAWLNALAFGKRRSGAIAAVLRLHGEHAQAQRQPAPDAGAGAAPDRRRWAALVVRHGRAPAERWLELLRQWPAAPQAPAPAARAALAAQLAAMPAASLAELRIGGNELRRLDGAPAAGRWIGAMLDELLHACARGELPNDKQALLAEAARRLNEERT